MSKELVISDPSRGPVPQGRAQRVVWSEIQEIDDIDYLDTGCAALQGRIAAWKKRGAYVQPAQQTWTGSRALRGTPKYFPRISEDLEFG